MYHLRLIKGLSYKGTVSASKDHPDVFTNDARKYKAALRSGHFEAVSVPEDEPLPCIAVEVAVGHLDREQLDSMTLGALKKLAADMGIDTTRAYLKTKK